MFSQKKGEGYIEHWIMPGVKTSSPWLENLPVKPLSNSNTLQDCRVMQQKFDFTLESDLQLGPMSIRKMTRKETMN